MNEELKGLYEADIESSGENSERKARVQALLDEGEVVTAADYHHAALIFQHGDNPSDYKKANELAKKAMEMGDERSKWLYAATLDRWLLSTGKPQRYGTQFIQKKNGDWEIAKPIDETVTDKQRAKYNVPPLAEALSEFRKKYNLR